jgi:hypothetical protein
MADRSRPAGGTRRVYSTGGAQSRRDRPGAARGAGYDAGQQRREPPGPPARRTGGRSLVVRVLLALLMVLAVGAIAFLIGYLIGLKIAIVALPLL